MNKKKSGVARIFLLVLFLSSKGALASPTCRELPGELHLLSVKGFTRDQFGDSKLEKELRIRLKEEAKRTCSENEFCTEKASLKTIFYFDPWNKVTHAEMTAIVNCLD